MPDIIISVDDILSKCAEIWFKRFGGISAIEIGKTFKISNKRAMSIFEQFVAEKKGKINSNVTLYSVPFPVNPKSKREFPKGKKVITHIFFPSKEILNYYYYLSSISKENMPEYKKRLCLGGNQIELIFFRDEVLKRYYDHPEMYEIDDTLAGGRINSKGDSIEEKCLYVRYGKKLINYGKTSITVILSDLESMSPDEQKYWSAFELNDLILDPHDANFQLFLKRTYDGEHVTFPNIFERLDNILSEINSKYDKGKLFNNYRNIHLRPPVEDTFKSFCDCCSELYKIIGPDNINSTILKSIIFKVLNIDEKSLIHSDTNRPFSTIEMLKLIERRFNVINLTIIIERIKQYRINADHKILKTTNFEDNYVKLFYKLCDEVIEQYRIFRNTIFSE